MDSPLLHDDIRTFFLNSKEEVEIPVYSIPTLLQPTVTQPQQATIPITLTSTISMEENS